MHPDKTERSSNAQESAPTGQVTPPKRGFEAIAETSSLSMKKISSPVENLLLMPRLLVFNLFYSKYSWLQFIWPRKQ